MELSDTHGGSMKYFICKKNDKRKNTQRLSKYLTIEMNLGLNKFNTYKKFAQRVQKSKKDLLNLLKNLKKKNKKIISYGATYKSTTVCTVTPLPLQTQPAARFQLLHAQQRCDIEHPDF